MYIGFYNYHTLYNKNRMLNDPSSPIGNNLMYPFFLLHQRLRAAGHAASTIDSDALEKFDAVVFVDFPGMRNKYLKKLIGRQKNLYLIVCESPAVNSANLNLKNHAYFKKIFTWQDELVDNKKYFKLNYSHNLPEQFRIDAAKKEKLCTLIASHKFNRHPAQLSSERIKAIRWFESNHPQDFDLYGMNWDRYDFGGEFLGIKLARLNRLSFLTKLLAPSYPSYRGKIASKKAVYEKYQFSICYENVRNFKGYITEKIFDCFLGGCIPVYLGADNIADHIPADAFIDKRKFANYEALYQYIAHMPRDEYEKYLRAIEYFITSKKAYPFTAEYFVQTLMREIIPQVPELA